MKISRLRLSGFKSFVDPTELAIEPGLTGIVGPNGCGKSNLLEALRWVMGENSAKSMRGAGMEDVIFQGTSARPMRHMAEVVLVLDNAQRRAPAAHNDTDMLEISRRIERDAGSLYRINGREVRQRDVHLLFADASTGAHSPALVRQGQISQIINAKPIQRRAILEEAAGISGLHSRRHEAELRLRAAETNLQRLTDVLQELDGQLAQLKRQARQATRYRNLSDHLRRAEALSLHVRWTGAAAGVAETEQALGAHQAAVAQTTEAAAHAATRQAEAQAALPPLRDVEAERAAALQRLTLERDALAREEAQARAAIDRLDQRRAQTATDLAQEQARADDARATLTRLADERAQLEMADAAAAGEAETAAQTLEAASRDLAACESALEALTAEAARLQAERRSTAQAVSQAEGTLARLIRERDDTLAQITRIKGELAQLPDLQAAEANAVAATQAREAALAAVSATEEARNAALAGESEARDALQPLERQRERLKAEAQTLVKLLRAGTPDLFPALLDQISVAPGFEAALGAALGDDLIAPLDEAAPIHWTTLAPYPEPAPLPDGVQALSDLVAAPPALARRLSQTGVVAPEDGARLQPLLQPGQRLVTRDGALWRWDGLTAGAEAPTAAAVRLAQRNRLQELDGEIEALEQRLAEARAVFDAARQHSLSTNVAEQEARAALRAADAAAQSAQNALQRATREAAERSARLTGLEETAARLDTALGAAEAALTEIRQRAQALPDGADLEARIAAAREAVAVARHAAAEARARRDALASQEQQRRHRIAAISRDMQDWSGRADAAAQQTARLTARDAEDAAERERLAALPGEIAARRSALIDMLAEAETARRAAADALATAEQMLAEADRAAKQTNAAQASAREDKARAEAQLDAARARLAEAAQRIRDAMECAPGELLARAEHPAEAPLPALDQIEEKLERLRREREALGGVNLRAEDEARELQERLDSMLAEKTDLEAAIAKLRGGIQSLNREGRERLIAAFDAVNGEFKRLFTTLFGGGEAELTLVESDDPLEAGLEILARPPGKKLASISLLSGGEQALTALSLIFAVFLTNPAPICVLDEVDAPLDDANVERFCNLLEEMVKATDTRFLIITHHALTMSRMHRLFGVTMAERGVSQLVSVDLAGAEQVLAAE